MNAFVFLKEIISSVSIQMDSVILGLKVDIVCYKK